MRPAIEILKLGKQYKLTTSAPYVALRDVISESAKNIFSAKKKEQDSFWALQDINFSIEPGERVGIIGRNGAGKSTLLKIISRITPPTTGEAIIRGRVGSLLEVGTGFHPELSGRENIYLNGSILGLKRAEITKQLDAIIDFSGVEKFIDTPLKHYSSGMQLRLAFSVAAHLEPEILLIDEVLAVGDMEFQKKCLGKMEEVSKKDGRTILFVSHNMDYISALCNKAILLDKGIVVKTSNSKEVISEYVTNVIGKSFLTNGSESHIGNSVVKLTKIQTVDENGTAKNNFSVTEKIGIEMKFQVLHRGHELWLGYNIVNEQGVNVFDTHNVSSPFYNQVYEAGEYSAIAWIPENLFNTGSYFIGCAIFNHLKQVIHFHEKDSSFFSVHDSFDAPTARGLSPGNFTGIIRPLLNWDVKKIDR